MPKAYTNHIQYIGVKSILELISGTFGAITALCRIYFDMHVLPQQCSITEYAELNPEILATKVCYVAKMQLNHSQILYISASGLLIRFLTHSQQ